VEAALRGLQVAGVKRLKALEDEKRRLKEIVADQAVELAMLRDLVGRRWWRLRSGGASSPTSNALSR
jgi:putative transposase